MAEVEVRPPRPSDAAPAAAVHLMCWRESYPGIVPQQMLDEMDEQRYAHAWERITSEHAAETMIALVDGDVVGFAGTRPSRDEPPVRDLELWGMYLRAAHHGSGLASRLLEGVIEDRPASLRVFEANARARAFYGKHGFVADGARQSHERFGGAAELRMVR